MHERDKGPNTYTCKLDLAETERAPSSFHAKYSSSPSLLHDPFLTQQELDQPQHMTNHLQQQEPIHEGREDAAVDKILTVLQCTGSIPMLQVPRRRYYCKSARGKETENLGTRKTCGLLDSGSHDNLIEKTRTI
jgi:hypothetical protein